MLEEENSARGGERQTMGVRLKAQHSNRIAYILLISV